MYQESQADDVEVEGVGAATDGLPAAPSGWTDPLTGTDGPRLWDRVISSEVARVSRYHRPATVVLVDVAGLDDFARAWGTDVAERLFIQLARTMSVESRSSDHIARIDRTRFAILLTETDEIAAINFVERVRAACECRATRARSREDRHRMGQPRRIDGPAGGHRRRRGSCRRRARYAQLTLGDGQHENGPAAREGWRGRVSKRVSVMTHAMRTDMATVPSAMRQQGPSPVSHATEVRP